MRGSTTEQNGSRTAVILVARAGIEPATFRAVEGDHESTPDQADAGIGGAGVIAGDVGVLVAADDRGAPSISARCGDTYTHLFT
jgi:hypothetical protein